MKAPGVALQVLLVFGVDGAKLPVQSVFEKQRVYEELRKSIQGSVERRCRCRWLLCGCLGAAWRAGSRDFKVIVGRAKGRVGVGIAIVRSQVLVVGILNRVLRGLLIAPAA